MKAILFLILLIFHAINAFPAGIAFSGLPFQYAREMEYYYITPRKNFIKPLLRAFATSKWLSKSENRLVLAAFLSEILKKNQTVITQDMLSEKMDMDILQTIAWAYHLAGQDNLAIFNLIANPLLQSQIQSTPANLVHWEISQDAIVPQMFMAAFLASGKSAYLEKLIRETATNKSSGTMAAALLYDFAPRHPEIVRQIAAFLESRPSSATRKKLELILNHARKDASK